MSNCGCNLSPCACIANSTSDTENIARPTKCDLDRRNNIWVEGADSNGDGGICLLDTMEEHQVIRCLHQSERSHSDLRKVTSDPRLLELANTVPLYPLQNEGDQLQVSVNSSTIPLYTIFQGNPPYAQ